MTHSSVQTTAQPDKAPIPSRRLNGEPDVPALLLRDPCHLEILIPARNEAQRLPHTLMRTAEYLEKQQYSSSIVVIDNASSDHTADLASKIWSHRVPVHLTGCASPGKGAAVRRGILTSRARFVGYMDADMATAIETLDAVMPLLGDNQAVVGSRRISGAILTRRQPPLQAIGGVVFRTMTRRVLRDLSDPQCAFKIFSGDLARAVARQLTVDGFAFEVEMLRMMSDMGAHIKEIPVVWADAKGSDLKSLRDVTRAASELYQLSRRRSG